MPDSPDPSANLTLLGVTQNSDNFGVRVLMSAAVEAIDRAIPGARIQVLDYGVSAAEWKEHLPGGIRQVSLVNLRFSWKLHLPNNAFRLVGVCLLARLLPRSWRARWHSRNPWLAAIARSDAHLSIAGGDSFSDIYGLRRYLYVILPQVLVLILGQPLIQLPQTYGPFRSSLARATARWILRRSRAVFSRDVAGIRVVQELMGSKVPQVIVSPDIGLSMSGQRLPAEAESYLDGILRDRPLIGLNVSRLLYIGGYAGGNMFGLRADFRELIDKLVIGLVQDVGASVLLVPHVAGGPLSQEDETRLSLDLCDRFRTRVGNRVWCLPHALDHRQTKTLIGRCDLFTGARMHACIAAVSQSVPAVCLAYSDKFAGVMAPLGPAAQVVDLRTATVDDVLHAITSALTRRSALAADLRSSIKQLPDFSQALLAALPDRAEARDQATSDRNKAAG